MASEVTPEKNPAIAATKVEPKPRKIVSTGAKISSPINGKTTLSFDLRAVNSTGKPVGFKKSVRLDAATLEKKYAVPGVSTAWTMVQRGLGEIGQAEAVAAFK